MLSLKKYIKMQYDAFIIGIIGSFAFLSLILQRILFFTVGAISGNMFRRYHMGRVVKRWLFGLAAG